MIATNFCSEPSHSFTFGRTQYSKVVGQIPTNHEKIFRRAYLHLQARLSPPLPFPPSLTGSRFSPATRSTIPRCWFCARRASANSLPSTLPNTGPLSATRCVGCREWGKNPNPLAGTQHGANVGDSGRSPTRRWGFEAKGGNGWQ